VTVDGEVNEVNDDSAARLRKESRTHALITTLDTASISGSCHRPESEKPATPMKRPGGHATREAADPDPIPRECPGGDPRGGAVRARSRGSVQARTSISGDGEDGELAGEKKTKPKNDRRGCDQAR